MDTQREIEGRLTTALTEIMLSGETADHIAEHIEYALRRMLVGHATGMGPDELVDTFVAAFAQGEEPTITTPKT